MRSSVFNNNLWTFGNNDFPHAQSISIDFTKNEIHISVDQIYCNSNKTLTLLNWFKKFDPTATFYFTDFSQFGNALYQYSFNNVSVISLVQNNDRSGEVKANFDLILGFESFEISNPAPTKEEVEKPRRMWKPR